MKKILAAFLIVLLSAVLFVSYGEKNVIEGLNIVGLPKNRLVSGDNYYDIFSELDGVKVTSDWTVSNSAVARITSGRKLYVRAVKEIISFELTAKHPRTGLMASITLTAVPNAQSLNIRYADGRAIDGAISVDVSKGPVKIPLAGVATPKGADFILFWESSDEKIAEVDDNGVLTVREKGNAKIAVKTVNGRRAEIKLHAYYAPNAIEINAPDVLAINEKAKIECTVLPEEATGVKLTYNCLDPKVLSVDQTGAIKALRAGMARITVTTENGIQAQKVIECYYPVTEIDFTNNINIAVGETQQLIVRVKPTNAKYKDVEFYSENPDIAVVDNDGNVTGVAAGKVRIYAVAGNGVKARKEITVKFIAIQGLSQKDFYKNMTVGSEYTFALQYNPANTSQRGIYFESSNTDVAVVDEAGVITAVQSGRARITARSENKQLPPVTLNIRVMSSEDALPLEGIVVGINPGHQITRDHTQLPVAPGAKTTKNANNGYAIGVKTRNTEYQVNLDVSLLLREKLEALGATVVMTRTTNDVKINNIERAEMLNAAGCDVALQIHCNNSDNKKSVGFQAFAKSKDTESQMISAYILKYAAETAGAKTRPCRLNDGYMSLNWSTTPSILLELGYMSNPEEDVLLGKPEYQALLAESIAQGLVEYFN